MKSDRECNPVNGFTLIELSIVLVIIGLIVGGVLVGQNLISAAEVRATVTQIEKYNTAANTFRGKYGYLPGDIKDPDASSFGFAARGTQRGQGDGNGILESNAGAGFSGARQSGGETTMFWVDLSAVRLIEGTFSAATTTTPPAQNVTLISAPSMDAYLPQAKLGHGHYIYIYSNGTGAPGTWQSTGINYFGILGISQISTNGLLTTNPQMTVSQAYAIDKKIDDGIPTSGRVTAQYVSTNNDSISWNGAAPSSTYSVAPASTTCYDDNSVALGPWQYSLSVSNGSNPNCALSFQFQ